MTDAAPDGDAPSTPWSPPLPPGEAIELPGRGTTFVRTMPGPRDAPTVLLLHGWTATMDINWFRCFEALGQHYRVVALDHRGHGRGIRSRRRFRLADCADDAMALCDRLGLRRVIPVGYSMGGPVAQLCWKQHHDRVRGLVLCATASYFSGNRSERLSFLGLAGLAAVARVTTPQARARITEQLYLSRKSTQWGDWAISEASRHDWRAVAEAGSALGTYNARDWITTVDVPTSVVITMQDNVVPVRRQERLFEAIPDAEAYRVDGDHGVVAAPDERFNVVLLRAIRSVVERSSVVP